MLLKKNKHRTVVRLLLGIAAIVLAGLVLFTVLYVYGLFTADWGL